MAQKPHKQNKAQAAGSASAPSSGPASNALPAKLDAGANGLPTPVGPKEPAAAPDAPQFVEPDPENMPPEPVLPESDDSPDGETPPVSETSAPFPELDPVQLQESGIVDLGDVTEPGGEEPTFDYLSAPEMANVDGGPLDELVRPEEPMPDAPPLETMAVNTDESPELDDGEIASPPLDLDESSEIVTGDVAEPTSFDDSLSPLPEPVTDEVESSAVLEPSIADAGDLENVALPESPLPDAQPVPFDELVAPGLDRLPEPVTDGVEGGVISDPLSHSPTLGAVDDLAASEVSPESLAYREPDQVEAGDQAEPYSDDVEMDDLSEPVSVEPGGSENITLTESAMPEQMAVPFRDSDMPDLGDLPTPETADPDLGDVEDADSTDPNMQEAPELATADDGTPIVNAPQSPTTPQDNAEPDPANTSSGTEQGQGNAATDEQPMPEPDDGQDNTSRLVQESADKLSLIQDRIEFMFQQFADPDFGKAVLR